MALTESGAGTIDGKRVARDGNKRTGPLLVSKGSGALEDDVGALLELGQVKGSSGRNNKVVQSDGRA